MGMDSPALLLTPARGNRGRRRRRRAERPSGAARAYARRIGQQERDLLRAAGRLLRRGLGRSAARAAARGRARTRPQAAGAAPVARPRHRRPPIRREGSTARRTWPAGAHRLLRAPLAAPGGRRRRRALRCRARTARGRRQRGDGWSGVAPMLEAPARPRPAGADTGAAGTAGGCQLRTGGIAAEAAARWLARSDDALRALRCSERLADTA